MRCTKIRTKENKPASLEVLRELRKSLQYKFDSMGFLTQVEIYKNVSKKIPFDPTNLRDIVRKIKREERIKAREEKGIPEKIKPETYFLKIGIHMGCFRIDTARLGSNARLDDNYRHSVKGYKRTNVPTWEQRVDFNHVVNDAFDQFGLSATIVSGPYRIRDFKTGRINSWTSEGQGMFERQEGLISESEARDLCQSDEREAKHRKAMREARKLAKKQKAIEGVSEK